MSRPAILARIRKALGETRASDPGRRTAAEKRLAQPFRHLIPARAQQPRPDLVTCFKEELRRQSAHVVEVETAARVPTAIAAYLAEHGVPPRVRCGDDAFLAALPWAMAVQLERARGAAEPGDTASVSHALAGVAETGTLVLASSPSNPASLAFLPETHCIIIAEDAIVGAFEDAIDRVRAAFGRHAMPRSLNLISGPSRTGDIGGRIVLGAHGPRRLAVIVFKSRDGAR